MNNKKTLVIDDDYVVKTSGMEYLVKAAKEMLEGS